MRFRWRGVMVCVALAAGAAGAAAWSLTTGDLDIPLADAVAALFGHGPEQTVRVVSGWRLPRTLLAVILGGALAVSGALFQTLTRNPLGSPDIIGFNAGAYTGALLAIVAGAGGFFSTASGALLGGVAAAALVYALAYQRGVQGFRLIVVGIAVAGMLTSLNTWIILKADVQTATAAAVWGVGTLNGVSWQQAGPASATVAVVLVATAFAVPGLRQLELGDDSARARGVRVERTRLALVLFGVTLTAVATSVAGPIAFVALVSPQIARRLSGGPSIPLVASFLTGSILLSASDLVAARLFPGIQLPVGVVTVSLGGAYFLWLLLAESRRRPI